jgi:hypothetical protein
MTDHDELRLSLGSYLTGALGPTARAELEDHLKLCEACRAELVELAALPGLLGRLGREGLDARAFGSDPTGSEPAGPPDRLLSGLLARARQVEEASRRRLRRLRAATAAITAAAVVAAAFALAPTLASRPAAGTGYQLHAEAPSAGLAGRVTLLAKPWGTELELSLRGLPAGEDCEAVVIGRDGQRATIGSWGATPDHAARVDVATDLPPSQLDSLTVQTVAGAALLGVTLDR